MSEIDEFCLIKSLVTQHSTKIAAICLIRMKMLFANRHQGFIELSRMRIDVIYKAESGLILTFEGHRAVVPSSVN
jgi:hypothetical protein